MNGLASCTTSCWPSPPSTGSPPPATSSSSKATPTASASAPPAPQLDEPQHPPQDDTANQRWSLGRGNTLVPCSSQMTIQCPVTFRNRARLQAVPDGRWQSQFPKTANTSRRCLWPNDLY